MVHWYNGILVSNKEKSELGAYIAIGINFKNRMLSKRSQICKKRRTLYVYVYDV